MTKILAIISTHGNELLGPNLLAYMFAKRSKLLENIEFIMANPRAYAKNVRYTESDLNRSYGLSLDTYEGRRAKIIEERIRLLKPELVLDFHTTTAEQPNILITADKDNEVVQRFVSSSAVKDILVVKPLNDITTVVSNFAAYEVPNSHLNDDLYEQICTDIARYLDEEAVDQERTFYKMIGKILPEEERKHISKTVLTPGLDLKRTAKGIQAIRLQKYFNAVPLEIRKSAAWVGIKKPHLTG